jgi:Lhr-like helicase
MRRDSHRLLPFWFGEAPQRTRELSEFVAELREEIDRRTRDVLPGYVSQAVPEVAAAAAFLKENCGVDDAGAEQLIAYVAAGRAVLGVVPSVTTIVAERFFDEGGGMQLILHAPFGGRINKAWGLALRKRFCRGFNFELQAAATDNGLNICLAEQHSFPLSDVFHFLTTETVGELLEQASLGVADLQDAMAVGCCAEFATVTVPKRKEGYAAGAADSLGRFAGQCFSAGGGVLREHRGGIFRFRSIRW